MKTVPELVAAATARGGMRPERAEAIAAAVLGTLRELVPEEAGDVAAVLPEELRRFWATAVPS
ncbi:MAG: DUF2267 domain-containing protein [Acidimicrobiia bacterium]|nr:DUF2267 domain-containing protein [Acidimicrobiia bacterium]